MATDHVTEGEFTAGISKVGCLNGIGKIFVTLEIAKLIETSSFPLADDRLVFTGEREHATALYMACRHLPPQLLASPGERDGMLTEAAKILKKIGDNQSLEECYKLMKHFGISVKV